MSWSGKANGRANGKAEETVLFFLDGKEVEALPGETIWQAAQRYGTSIPHLCWLPEPGYRADGNCRACMVEIGKERVLAASCIRKPEPGMEVSTASKRAVSARAMVMELLLADQPPQERAHDKESRFWRQAKEMGVTSSRLPARGEDGLPGADFSHGAMAVQLDACIHCNLCVRACREVQVNDVIGMAHRGNEEKIVFDFDDPMGESTCVACGECVQACPTGALMPASLVDNSGEGARRSERQVDSVCPYCGVGCQITYHINDEKIAWVDGREGPANQNRLCVKGRFGFDYITHEDRLLKPLIRREDAPSKKSLLENLDRTLLMEHFREASWDEALEAAANGLKNLRDKHGGKSLAGFGSAKCSNEEAFLFQKLVRTGFGSNNVDHCTRLCHASSVAALMETIGTGAVTAPFTAVADSDVIIVIGANPTENHPVAATYFKQAVKRGAKLIVMDPRGQALARHATHMLQFRPGTDVALLNAVMHVIVEEELYDSQYIQAHTDGFDALQKHLRGCDPETMAQICGIPPSLIRTVAREYARANASIIFWGMGVSQHVHGTDNARCLISLALMTGHTGRPGTGLHPLRGQNNVQGASDAGLIPMVFPDYRKLDDAVAKTRLEELWGQSLDSDPGLTVVEVVHAIHDGDVRGMYILGENPAMSDPDLTHARSALASLEHLVVQDIFPTETALFADVILPASAWPEKDGTVTNTNRQVQLGRKALSAPGDARADWWITQELARRMGLEWNYDSPADVFAEMKQAMVSLDNITWERLQKESSVTYPCKGDTLAGEDIIFSDRFPTEDGRGRFVPAGIVAPDELPDEEYPMVLSTGRQLEHWHTGAMTRRAKQLDAIEPSASVSMSPRDLERLKIAAGERIRITTRRGAIELTTRADPAILEGMLFVPFAYVESAANLLTNPALDPFGKIPEFKFCAARVETLASDNSDSSGPPPAG
ncbi:MAG: formate dehydrogenase subunit alpha [Hyphomicrobiales bacterium]|nr:formate dehydrogenase subunit alpha [Hyphomicrobiales bacterium]